MRSSRNSILFLLSIIALAIYTLLLLNWEKNLQQLFERSNLLKMQDGALLQNDKHFGLKLKVRDEKGTIASVQRVNISLHHSGFQQTQKLQTNETNGVPVIAVVVLSCKRVTVSRCLDQILQWRPSSYQFPLIVSQDCSNKEITNVILSYGDQLTFIRPPNLQKFTGYSRISQHYGWALNYTFFTLGFDTVIVVEDDLDIASDFFEYFSATRWLLINDPSLWCVSAWNDNGKPQLVDKTQANLLYRTDFFPGLGWMLTKELWSELTTKWPQSYWDDWMRDPDQRKGRACVRPELSRTTTFGKVGVSQGMYFEKHLKYMTLSNVYVKFTEEDLSYLLKGNYDNMFLRKVYTSPLGTYKQLQLGVIPSSGPVRVTYSTVYQFQKMAKAFGLMDDLRSGIPRTAYMGIVSVYYRGRRVFLTPEPTWTGYSKT